MVDIAGRSGSHFVMVRVIVAAALAEVCTLIASCSTVYSLL